MVKIEKDEEPVTDKEKDKKDFIDEENLENEALDELMPQTGPARQYQLCR